MPDDTATPSIPEAATKGANSAPTTSTDALPHVWRTLEAEGRLSDTLGTEVSTPEGRIEEEAASPDVPSIVAGPNLEPVSDQERAETLKTRLPGDTSSDPHTDLPS
jgi:hypothetical protein